MVAEASLYYEVFDVLVSAGPPICFPFQVACFSISEGGGRGVTTMSDGGLVHHVAFYTAEAHSSSMPWYDAEWPAIPTSRSCD